MSAVPEINKGETVMVQRWWDLSMGREMGIPCMIEEKRDELSSFSLLEDQALTGRSKLLQIIQISRNAEPKKVGLNWSCSGN